MRINGTRSTMFFRPLLLAWVAAFVMGGCSGSKQSETDMALVWPSPPDQPRIKYLRTMHGEDDYQTGLGTITRTLAGGGTAGTLTSPYDICTDGHGRFWVTDASRGIILFDDVKREFEPIGELSNIALNSPRGIAYGDNKLFVGLVSLGQIVALTPEGKDLYTIGRRGQFPNPVDVVYDSVKHHVIVVDNKLHTVSVFTEKGDSVFAFGNRGNEDGMFNFPQSVALDSAGNFYVVDAFNFRIEIFDSAGKFLRKFGSHGDAWGMFARPKGIALDAHGNIYVCDAVFHNLQVFNQQGELLLFVGKFSSENNGFQDPISVLIDQAKKELYITDQLNNRVQVFQLVEGD